METTLYFVVLENRKKFVVLNSFTFKENAEDYFKELLSSIKSISMTLSDEDDDLYCPLSYIEKSLHIMEMIV